MIASVTIISDISPITAEYMICREILTIGCFGAFGAPNDIVARYRPGNTLRTTQPMIADMYNIAVIIICFNVSTAKVQITFELSMIYTIINIIFNVH
jgi:hypothetical protein